MTQHLHQFVRDIPRPKATSEYYWKRVQLIGFMCYCKKCNHRVDTAGIIPEKCPNCGDGLEEERMMADCNGTSPNKDPEKEIVFAKAEKEIVFAKGQYRGVAFLAVKTPEKSKIITYEDFDRDVKDRFKEPKDNSLPPCCDCVVDESSCEFERLTCTAQKHYKDLEKPLVGLTKHFDSLDIEPPEEPGKEEAKWVKWPGIHDSLWVCSQCGQQMGAANKDQLPEKCSNCGASMEVE